jgi:hypothetical protein
MYFKTSSRWTSVVTSVVLAIGEDEIKRIIVQSQPGKNFTIPNLKQQLDMVVHTTIVEMGPCKLYAQAGLEL